MRTIILGVILLVGCSDRSEQKDTNPNHEPRNAMVSGFVECQGRRLEIVDGLIDFGTEPLEWEKYSIDCILAHEALSQDQIDAVRNGKWVDLNFQRVPDGFPVTQCSNGLPFSPVVTVSFGRWDVASPPQLERLDIGLHLTHFDEESHLSVVLERAAFKVLQIKLNPLTVEFATEGAVVEDGKQIKWKIQFSTQYYGDPWPLYRHYTGPWYTSAEKTRTEQTAPSDGDKPPK